MPSRNASALALGVSPCWSPAQPSKHHTQQRCPPQRHTHRGAYLECRRAFQPFPGRILGPKEEAFLCFINKHRGWRSFSYSFPLLAWEVHLESSLSAVFQSQTAFYTLPLLVLFALWKVASSAQNMTWSFIVSRGGLFPFLLFSCVSL